MSNLRHLRETYRLTIRGVSHITGISAYKLTRVEAGRARLNANERAKLALVFGVPQETFCDDLPTNPRTSSITNRFVAAIRRHMLFFMLLFVGVLSVVMVSPVWMQTTQAQPKAQTPTPQHITITKQPLFSYSNLSQNHGRGGTVQDVREEWALLPTIPADRILRAPEVPTPTSTPTPTPIPTAANVWLIDAGPYGCPLQPASGRIVLTQGYGVGTHAPAEEWGAIDLALASPAETQGVPVVATHSGTASVVFASYPGGNQVSVSGGGWRTNYAHLSEVLVEHGAYVAAGTVIGLVGNTGMSSGPHLDYQVWSGSVNIDPTELVQACW